MLRVLMVEDSPADALLVRCDLADLAPGQVDLAVVSTLAGALVAVSRTTFDCVLLDLALPDAAGLAGLEALRERAPELPVVVLSGGEELAALAAEAGGPGPPPRGGTPPPRPP